jgi:Domain of unknown function (DUF4158)
MPRLWPRVARQLGVEPAHHGEYDTTGRTWKHHRAEIRTLLGFREATVADAALLEAWLGDQVPGVGASPDQLAVLLETRCRELSIEAPAADRIDRIVRAAIHSHDGRFCADTMGRLAPGTRARLEALLRPAENGSDSSVSDPPAQPAPALLLRLRSDPGKPSLAVFRTSWPSWSWFARSSCLPVCSTVCFPTRSSGIGGVSAERL